MSAVDTIPPRGTREVLDAVFAIAEAAASGGELDELYRSIHTIVGRLMPAKNLYLALSDDAQTNIRFAYFVDEQDTAPGPQPRPVVRGLTEYAIRSRRGLLADATVQQQLVRAGEIELLGIPSLDWMGAPLVVGDRVLGVLVIQSYDPAVRYRTDDLEILSFVARQVALVLDRKQVEDRLRETHAAVHTLVDNLPGVAYRCANDPAWTMEYLSSGIRRLTGWSAEELLGNRGRSFASLIDDQDRQRVWNEVQKAIAARRAWTLEYRIRTADGGTKWILERGSGVFEADRPVGLEGFFTDVTEQRRAEHESTRLAEERREAQRRAAVGQLAESVAHGLNNILAPALLAADHLVCCGAEKRREASIVRAAVLRARDHIDRLLAIGGRHALVIKPVDLRGLVVARERAIRAGLPANVVLSVRLAAQPVPVLADPFWIGEVIDGLVARARDAMPMGGTIDIAVESGAAGGTPALTVSDTGSASPAETARRLYEPFPSGGGLGLSFLHGIVEQHGGDIRVGPSDAGGTSFRVILPAERAESHER